MKKSGCSVQISFCWRCIGICYAREDLEVSSDQKKVVPESGTQSNIESHQELKV